MGDHDRAITTRAITTYEGWAKRNPTQSNTNGRRDTGCAAPVIGTVNGNLPRHGKTALVSVSMLLTRLRQDENTREIPETSNPTSPDHRYSQPFDTICETIGTIGTLGTSNTVIGLAIGQPPAPSTRHQPTSSANAPAPATPSAITSSAPSASKTIDATGTLKPSALSDPKRRQRSQPSQRHQHKSALIHRNIIALRLTRIHLARPANLGHRVVQHFAVLRNPAGDAAEREQRREHGRVETNRAVN